MLSCIVATLSDGSRERKDKLMMQDATREDRVVLTKTRHEEAFARVIVEHDGRETNTCQIRRLGAGTGEGIEEHLGNSD